MGDTSLFGATSPILGKRYRFEVAPTLGDVNFTGVLADYRHYVMPVRPYTFAFRVHPLRPLRQRGRGRRRLQPLFVGYPNLVRGYDVNSFSARGVRPPDTSECPVFDQLLGSRVAVANLELRFPPFGAFGGKGLYGPIPIELLGFADVGRGLAERRQGDARLQRGRRVATERRPVRSVGVGARVNVFGYAILEVDYAKPLDRAGEGLGLGLQPEPGVLASAAALASQRPLAAQVRIESRASLNGGLMMRKHFASGFLFAVAALAVVIAPLRRRRRTLSRRRRASSRSSSRTSRCACWSSPGRPGARRRCIPHPDHVVYIVAGGKARFTMPDGKTQELESKPGEARWTPAGSHATRKPSVTRRRSWSS